MITQITKKQESKMSEYVEKYIKIGLNTERIDKQQCKSDIDEIYVNILGRKKVPVIVLENPYMCWIAVNMFCQNRNGIQVYNQVNNQIYKQIWNQVRDQVNNQVRVQIYNQVNNRIYKQVWNQVRNQVDDQVRVQIYNQIYNQIYKRVRNQVRDQVRIQIYKQVWNQIRGQVSNQVDDQVKDEKIMDYISPYFQGSYDTYIFSYFDYIIEALGVKIENKLKNKYDIWKNTTKYGQIYSLNNICIVSEKPLKINLNERRRLHADMEPAIKYSGGLELYYLNGIKVPKWIVMSKKENIKITDVMKIKNVDVRTQAIKKIGIEKLEKEMKFVEKKGDYILYDASNIFGEYQPLLKMKNPSVPLLWHMEYVHPNCKTIQQSINWRYSKDINKQWEPTVLT